MKPRFNEFNFQVIAEFFDKDAAYELEQQLIKENWGHRLMMNKYHSKAKFNRTGIPHSTDTKRKLSNALKNKPTKPRSEETKHKISNALMGRKLSIEHKEKLSNEKKGKKRGPYKTKQVGVVV